MGLSWVCWIDNVILKAIDLHPEWPLIYKSLFTCFLYVLISDAGCSEAVSAKWTCWDDLFTRHLWGTAHWCILIHSSRNPYFHYFTFNKCMHSGDTTKLPQLWFFFLTYLRLWIHIKDCHCAWQWEPHHHTECMMSDSYTLFKTCLLYIFTNLESIELQACTIARDVPSQPNERNSGYWRQASDKIQWDCVCEVLFRS